MPFPIVAVAVGAIAVAVTPYLLYGSVVSVSYTHLDVYKRQLLGSGCGGSAAMIGACTLAGQP